ncbi:S-adenosyl-L-methionine-dependent methyltransferase superfamily protein [Zea mays]|uniref:S-adenosyl-L-methionine-dependent methyltransferase superfamily protein n=1 Tax=Zea mays TaxID=4577 RepID=A0A1D6G5X3_MAIZE|nr:S-adenosyl-L-methionine-dependent methyltransferase superfamily protein [Zea mays]
MPPPAGLPPWPTPSTTRLATPTPTRPPPRTTHVRPPPPPYTRVRLPPPPPATTPLPPRLEPAAPKPAAVATLLPPSTASAASSSSTCLDCVHFGKCSGCTHEVDLDKPPVLQEVANFFKGHGVGDFTFSRGRLSQWRCRAKLAVRGTPENPLIGLYQEGTHAVIDIPECRAHHPSINAAVKLLRQGITELSIQPFDEDAGAGELRYVQMAVTTYNTSIPVDKRYEQGKVQVSLVWNSRDERSQNAEKLTSIIEIIFGHKWRHLKGERDMWERYGGVDISLDPCSFGQANTLSFNSLLHKLNKYVPRSSTVVDLYSGAGVIGLSVAASRKCRSVKCIEINKQSKMSFETSASRLPANLGCTITWHNTDASVEPSHWLEGSSVVIVDPPRKGLHPSVISALQKVALSERKAYKAKRLRMRRDHGSYGQGRLQFMLIIQQLKRAMKRGLKLSYTLAVDGKVLRGTAKA